MLADMKQENASNSVPNLDMSGIEHSPIRTDRSHRSSHRSSGRASGRMSGRMSNRSNLAASGTLSLISSRDMEELKKTLIAQTDKIQQKTSQEIDSLKKRMDSESDRRARAETELEALRRQVREEQRRREAAEQKTESMRARMVTRTNKMLVATARRRLQTSARGVLAAEGNYQQPGYAARRADPYDWALQ